MIAKLNNKGQLTLPENLIRDLKLTTDDELTISCKNNTIILKRVESKYVSNSESFGALFKGFNGSNPTKNEINWGKPVGKEFDWNKDK